MIESIKDLKKVELHIHLDGSLLPSTLAKLAGKSESELLPELVANDKCENLSEYLTKFDLPISYMQTKEHLTLVAKDLVDYFAEQNVIYAEIRFTPMFHTKQGLSYDEIIEAVLSGLNSNKQVKANLILCMMRGFDKEENIKTIEAAKRWLGKGVCAIDLAGAEDVYPLSDYQELFAIVRKYEIPFTIHAGENGTFNDVRLALDIGAKRIGHGIHAIDDDATIALLKEKNVLLEVCPTSNVQTNSVSTYKEHPIKDLYDKGIDISINTDNKTVSNVSLNDEYIKLFNAFNFSLNDFKKINQSALKYAFLSDDEKDKLLMQLQ